MLSDQLTVIALAIPALIVAYCALNYSPNIAFERILCLSNDEASCNGMDKISELTVLGSRFIFGFKCCVLASITLCVGIQVVANSRFLSKTLINPLDASKASHSFEVNCRYVSNTAEQLLLFVIGTMGACATTSIDINYIFIATVLFILGRILFWIGYHIAPTGRALGMGLTFCATFGLCYYSAFIFLFQNLPILLN